MISPRVLAILLVAPVVALVTPWPVAAGDATGSFLVRDPESQTIFTFQSLPTHLGRLIVISGPASGAMTGADAARAVTPTAAPALSLAGALAEPSHGSLDVSFSLAGATPARLELLDIQGRRVSAIEVGNLGAGAHTLRLGAAPGPGVYFLRLTSDGQALTRRVTRVP